MALPHSSRPSLARPGGIVKPLKDFCFPHVPFQPDHRFLPDSLPQSHQTSLGRGLKRQIVSAIGPAYGYGQIEPGRKDRVKGQVVHRLIAG